MKVLVLGARVTATCAWYLAKAGHEPAVVVDRQPWPALETLRQCRRRLPELCRAMGHAGHAAESGALLFASRAPLILQPRLDRHQ